ncbi:hypothetical protein ST47_g3617 [Ascochyta rabiei]|uniref:Uncharacterized protein n=1 Tax=Didymella rabiei TaxID=5454 RepID=A0A163HCC7_DIDRA|nr:hypothetical protein ST47_g3617 [Ascochyta rabiei]
MSDHNERALQIGFGVSGVLGTLITLARLHHRNSAGCMLSRRLFSSRVPGPSPAVRCEISASNARLVAGSESTSVANPGWLELTWLHTHGERHSLPRTKPRRALPPHVTRYLLRRRPTTRTKLPRHLRHGTTWKPMSGVSARRYASLTALATLKAVQTWTESHVAALGKSQHQPPSASESTMLQSRTQNWTGWAYLEASALVTTSSTKQQGQSGVETPE